MLIVAHALVDGYDLYFSAIFTKGYASNQFLYTIIKSLHTHVLGGCYFAIF